MSFEEMAAMGAAERMMAHSVDAAMLLAFLLLTAVLSKTVIAAFSLGVSNPRVLATVALAQLAVLPPRILVYTVFAYGILWPMSLPLALSCTAVVFAMMALVEIQLYDKGQVTDSPRFLGIVLNIGYLAALALFCWNAGIVPVLL